MSALVALIDSRGRDTSIEQRMFDEAGIRFVAAHCQDADEVVGLAAEATCILSTRAIALTAELMDRLPSLRAIVRYGIGVDNIDLDAATARGIAACNVVDHCVDEVANHAFALLLALNRQLLPLDSIVRQPDRAAAGEARTSLGPVGPIRGETLGLVAFGPIARSVATKALGFGLDVIVSDPYVDPSIVVDLVGNQPVALDELLTRSDYISVHAPGGPATVGLIGARELALCKPTAHIVLTSRGGVVDEEALHQALVEGRLAGAGVDVWDPEPAGPDKPLAGLPNVIATPHFAYYSERSDELMRERVAESAIDIVNGRVPRSVVNPKVLASAGLVPSEDR
ncbi:MAG: D-isomer specific 2-hydroxyacid dehydrogenase NAD-binding protein [Actinomycetia bacterium]|nr:D-isomer specific 2-hydroxyacid dehydrogenase NAD-binding protein [Actinomycetes bacterium]